MDNGVNVETLSNDQLRSLLMKEGVQCGPVMGTTRKVYENKLKRLWSGGRSPTSGKPSNITSTPGSGSDRISSIGSSAKSRADRMNRSGDYFGDASNEIYDDDRMEGEESFRYVGPVGDTPPSPYSALGGSLTSTPAAPSRPMTTLSSAAHRLDYGFQNTYSPPKPTSGFSNLFSRNTISPKSSTISYHTDGDYATDLHRRTTVPAAVAPRLAAPTNPYAVSESKNAFPFSWTLDDLKSKAKQWGPTVGKALGLVILIAFGVYFINRALKETGYYDEKTDEEVQQLPA